MLNKHATNWTTSAAPLPLSCVLCATSNQMQWWKTGVELFSFSARSNPCGLDLVCCPLHHAPCPSVILFQCCMTEGGDGWLSPGLLILISIRTYLLGTNRAPSTIQYTSAVTGPDVRQTFHLPQRELRDIPSGSPVRANRKCHTRVQTQDLMLRPWVKHKEL